MSGDIVAGRLATGIPALDPLLEGGFLEGGVYLLMGPPGAGKTIFGNQIAFHHASQGGQSVYITLLAESHTRMLAHLRRMSFFDPKLVAEHVYYLSGFKVLENDGLDGLLRMLRDAILTRKATYLVLDGFVSAEESSQTPKELKKFIHELQSITSMTGCTILLLSSTERARTFHPEHTMVDGIIVLSDETAPLEPLRHLQIRKMRGTNPIRGQHTFEITNDGLMVRPRIESLAPTPRTLEAVDIRRTRERKAFGIRQLDQMLTGGVPAESITMLLGPSGVGKTILGLQFLSAGIRAGEPAVYFGFHERPGLLIEKSRRVKLGIHDVDAKLLEMVWQLPVEGVIDILAERLLTAVRRLGAKRLFIDGLQGFEVAGDGFPKRIRGVYSAISEELERLGVTTLYAVETRDLVGPRIEVPIDGVSSITHNIILMRHVELRAQLYRLISILKVRDSSYDPTIREFRITDDGIVVPDTFDSAEHILSGDALTTTSRAARGQKKPATRSVTRKKARRKSS